MLKGYTQPSSTAILTSIILGMGAFIVYSFQLSSSYSVIGFGLCLFLAAALSRKIPIRANLTAITRRVMIVLSVVFLISLMFSPAARAAAITEYLLPPGQSGLPQGIAFQTGTNYVWFTEFGSYDKVGRLNQGTAEILEFKLLTGSRPWDIAYEKFTADNLWFTVAGRDKIASISNLPTEFTLSEWALSPNANPRGIDIQLSPGRYVWFTEFSRSAIGKLDPAGPVVEWSLPDSNAHPLDILYLPNSGVWFTEYDGNRIGFFNEVLLKEWPLIPGSFPYKLANDTFGNIWFTESGRNRIAKLNPYTNEITEYLIPTANSQPYGIWVDSHNNVWFTEHATNKIGKFMPGSNSFVEYARIVGASPWDVRATTDGKVWFSDDGGGRIGRLDPDVATSSMTVSTVSTASPILSTATTIGSSTMTKSTGTTSTGQTTIASVSTLDYPYGTTATTTSTTSYSASETSQIRRTSSMEVITSYVTQTGPTTITSTSYAETTSATTYVTATVTTTLQTLTTTTLTSTSTSYIGTTTSTQPTTVTKTATSTSYSLGMGTEIGEAIPGFPVESIIAGIGVAVACLMIMRRVRIRSRGEK